jgi:Kef-type K+ transport system membrane component KefB
MMVFIIRPLAARVLRSHLTLLGFVFLFSICAASAIFTESIGLHTLIGAFVSGLMMPRDLLTQNHRLQKLEQASSIVLLPIFFFVSGLRVEIGRLTSWKSWLLCAAIIALAVVGKMVGSAPTARRLGLSWRDSWSLGALMNTRGLMEFVVLNIGYDLKLLSPELFTMMAIMAIVTTMMTSPLLSFFHRES